MARNHNVDIRSTQLANAIKSALKSLPIIFRASIVYGLGGVLAGGFGFYIISELIIKPTILNQENSNRKEAKQLNLTNLTNDYERNEARYEINWKNIYVSYTGRIGNITKSSYSFAPQSIYFKGKRVDVQCSQIKDDVNTIAKYNPGSLVTVIGKSYGIREKYPGYIVTLGYCKIQ